MGGKGLLILKGSLEKHWIRYIVNMNINVNPTNNYSLNTAYRCIKILSTVPTKFVQPEFEYELNQISDSYKNASVLHLKWINGYERKYNMEVTSFDEIMFDVDYINDIVEFERNTQG